MTEVTVERDAICLTRDGIALRADIWRPAAAAGPVPVLLTRTPYNKAMPLNADTCRALAARGYIAVTQDLRGTHASDGDFDWIKNPASQPREARDGWDAVEWAARLPGSDGRVGTFGVSYMSHCSWSLAVAGPPALAAMHVGGMGLSTLDMTFGIFDIGRRLQWAYAQAADVRRRAGRSDGPLTREAANAEWMNVMQGKWLWHLPLTTIPEPVFAGLTGPLRDYLEIPDRSTHDYGDVHARLRIPVCTVTGWWDRLSLCVRHHERLQATAGRDRHRLVIGPWSHDPSTFRRDIGPRDYGPEADQPYPGLVADWFDEVLRGGAPARVGGGGGGNVSLMLVNEPGWRRYPVWPPPARDFVLHLHSDGRANTPRGSGRLAPEAPGDEPADRFLYDPADPLMSLMGRNSHNLPVDQSPHDHRPDILSYSTPPLEQDLVVAGYPRCEIWAASDAPDTDFTAKIVEIGPDGLALNVVQGILRTRYREGYGREVPLEPGRPTAMSIPLMPVGIRFRRGSRIRLDISSSDFPAFDRNHNTGGRDWAETVLRPARQTLFHDAAHPSRLVLPVLEAP